jgi:hypothetical protein
MTARISYSLTNFALMRHRPAPTIDPTQEGGGRVAGMGVGRLARAVTRTATPVRMPAPTGGSSGRG